MNTRCRPAERVAIAVLTAAGLLLALNQAFFWNLGGVALLRNQHLYLILGCFLPTLFLITPGAERHRSKVPLYDHVLAAVALGISLYFAWNGQNILTFGWDYNAPPLALASAFGLWVLVLEALRRTTGTIVMLIALVFSLYPLVAADIPVFVLQGIPFDLVEAAQMHSIGGSSILGLPLQATAQLLIGFLLFGVVLQHTGAADFFHDLALSLFGRYRGGSAKVAVVSSGSMGMMSGSAVSNVLTTGPMTIPAMVKSGYPPRYAAAVEATASTGGTITPPIMGTAAFLMVGFLGVPYSEVALAAAIPAALFYLGIFAQVDASAAKMGLRGLPRVELPKTKTVLLRGWVYLAAVMLLLVLLFVRNNEAQAPYYVTVFLLLVAMALKGREHGVRALPRYVVDLLLSFGRSVAEIVGIIAGVGLIVGGLSMTGVSLSLARELVYRVDGSVVLVLIAGAVTSFVLGMGMTVSAVYVFLAVVMVPALTDLGVNPVAAHLFVIYWATVSYITPPVALASFAAANLAGTNPMRTAFTATRLGSVKYLVPFAFVANPALVAQGSLREVLIAVLFAALGVVLLACAFEGWGLGSERRLGTLARLVLGASGAATFAPELISSVVGSIVALLTLVIVRLRRNGPEPEPDALARPRPHLRFPSSCDDGAEDTPVKVRLPSISAPTKRS